MDILGDLLSQKSLDFQSFQNLWLAFLTILIPLSIAVLSEYFEKQRNNEDFVVLDMHVILDGILKFKTLLATTALVFMSGLFWASFDTTAKSWAIFGWVVGTCFFVSILLAFYDWTRGEKDRARLKYYEGLNDNKAFIAVSNSIWSAQNITPQQESQFLRVFLKKLKELTEYE